MEGGIRGKEGKDGMIAIVTFPISLFWFAWMSYKSIHWIVPILASTPWGWSFYRLILMTYAYTEDSYKASFIPSLYQCSATDFLQTYSAPPQHSPGLV